MKFVKLIIIYTIIYKYIYFIIWILINIQIIIIIINNNYLYVKKKKKKDSVDAFYKDSADSAKHLLIPELTKVLTWESAAAVEWLSEKFKIDLSLVSRLGGHTYPRTHRGTERFPGMTITYTLLEALEAIEKAQPNRAKILKKANVTKLIKNEETGAVIGVEYQMNGETFQEFGPVIIATGGFAADFTESSLIKTFR